MKILILGNGFDLDHDLPTSYMDFLNFCNCVVGVDEEYNIYLESLNKTQVKYFNKLRDSEEIKSTFLSFIKDNCLLDYFNAKVESRGMNWIDFEREIKGIVTEFKKLEYALEHSNEYAYKTTQNHKIHQLLGDLCLYELDELTLDENALMRTG